MKRNTLSSLFTIFSLLLLNNLVKSQACKRWEDLCQGSCDRIPDQFRLISGCRDCVNNICDNIRGSESTCADFASTPCGKKVKLNCNDLRSIQEIFDCDFDDVEEGEDKNQPELPPRTIHQTATQPNISDASNQTIVIVIAVCVSVVVILISVLITGVYCWRIRRKTVTKKRSEEADFRNKAFTNDSYRRGGEIERSRPDSTYNTINDFNIEHEYRVLDSQGKECTNNDTTVNFANFTKEENTSVNENEYNRIKFNKPVVKNTDPSYSSIDTVETDSDYNSTCYKMSTSTAPGDYQYGVPIKIKDIDKLQAEHETCGVADNNSIYNKEKQNESDSDLNKSRDEREVYVDEISENRTSSEAKPRAVVSPIVKDSGLQLPISTWNRNGSNQIKVSRSTSEIPRVGDKTGRIDDYEIAVVNEASNEGYSKEGDYYPEASNVRITENPKRMMTDNYEIAVINNNGLSDSTSVDENLKTNVPIVQIIDNKTDLVTDNYEIAVLQNAQKSKPTYEKKEIIEGDENDTKKINFEKETTSGKSRTNDDYEIAVL